jgi:hypothetical protein
MFTVTICLRHDDGKWYWFGKHTRITSKPYDHKDEAMQAAREAAWMFGMDVTFEDAE